VTVVLFQVRVSRGIATVREGARATTKAGFVLAVACVVFVALLVLGALVQVGGELLQASGSWAVGFGLAPDDAQGQYQGLYSTGFSLSAMLAPAFLVALVVTLGWPGWLILGVVFLVTGLLVPPAAAWALRVPPVLGSARSATLAGEAS
jgi:MFS family permease